MTDYTIGFECEIVATIVYFRLKNLELGNSSEPQPSHNLANQKMLHK